MVFFTSDLHLGHKTICKYRTKFDTPKEHDDYVIDKILALGKRDILFVLGDFLFDGDHYEEYIERLAKKKCRIKLVMGNHDSKKLYKEDIFEMQLPLFSYKGMWVSHCPIHPQEMRNRTKNIHGHLHLESVMMEQRNGDFNPTFKTVKDPRYFNVNLDVNNYEFVPWETIIAGKDTL